jgi:hypothetical protein
VRRLVPLALLAALLAGCGKTHPPSKTTATTVAQPPAPHVPSPATVLAGSTTLYLGGNWAVVTKGRTVVVAHLVDGRWHADRSGTVTIDILGPTPGGKAAAMPQVAAEMKGPGRLIEEGLWVDGQELLEKGGGLTPSEVTVYGAPSGKLAPGVHTAIAYARTATTGTAVEWTFRVD